MSVREGDRQESNLKYVQDAEKLCAHTLQMCNNPNHFPETTLANQMKEEAIQVLCNVRYNLSAYTLNKKDTKTLFKYWLASAGEVQMMPFGALKYICHAIVVNMVMKGGFLSAIYITFFLLLHTKL